MCLAAPQVWCAVLCGQVNVLTSNYDNNRTNANLGEFVLNKSNVNPNTFGKLYSFPVDGEVYAQPLYVRGVSMPGGVTRNVLYVATMNNSIYAFDADKAGNGPLWSRNFGPAADPHDFDAPPDNTTNPPTPGLPYTDILDEVGILSTPVIDPTTKTLYAVHYTSSLGSNAKSFAYYLHALDLATGEEKFGGPTLIQATSIGSGWGGFEKPVNNQLAFDPSQHLQRPGLLLLNGMVYVAFGSHGDSPPWHGWLLAYDASTLQQTAAFNTTPNDGAGASIWQGGRGLAADAAGNIYGSTANGSWNGFTSWGQSVLRLTNTTTLRVADYFTPAEWTPLNNYDTDLGSTGPVLIPGTNLLYAIGKEGELFLLDRSNLGHETPLNGQIVQSFQAADPTLSLLQQEDAFLVFNDAFWDNAAGQLLYLWPNGQPLRSFRMKKGVFETTPYSANHTANNSVPFSGMTISANGSDSGSGILWATSATSSAMPAHGVLHAFDALNLSVELWNSDMQGSRDTMGNFVKFVNPTVANGKVFVATGSLEIDVYGLLPTVPRITSVVSSASYSNGAVAPGELVTIFGNSLGPASPAVASADRATGRLPFVLGGVRVNFGGSPAPLLYASKGQINAVVPFEVAGKSTVQMTITNANGQALNATLPVRSVNPSIFSATAAGTGQGAILNNSDLSQNSEANPAARGTVVAIYATGTGVTDRDADDGALTALVDPPLVVQPVTVTVDGRSAQVLYQGGAPGLVTGVSQINVQIPADVTPGPAVPVTIAIGSAQSNTVTMAVK